MTLATDPRDTYAKVERPSEAAVDWSGTMAVERGSDGCSLVDVLDRVLDKGIVIDAWVRVAVAGIDLITVEARVIVASIETYMRHSETLGFATAAEPRRLAVPKIGEALQPVATTPPSHSRYFRKSDG